MLWGKWCRSLEVRLISSVCGASCHQSLGEFEQKWLQGSKTQDRMKQQFGQGYTRVKNIHREAIRYFFPANDCKFVVKHIFTGKVTC